MSDKLKLERYVVAEFQGTRPVAFAKQNSSGLLFFTMEVHEAESFPTMKAALRFVKMNEKELGHCVVTQIKGCL